MDQELQPTSSQIAVRVPGHQYSVRIEEGLLTRAAAALGPLADRRKVFVLADETVWKLWGNTLLEGLKPIEPGVIRIPSGEQHKRLATVEKILDQLATQGAERSSLLLAFGGGVTGDLGGFAASIYLRGIDVVQIPTTLLAMVDSSIGGKTGANLGVGKNLVGTFYQPKMVLCDPLVLSTLPERELRAGLFEAVKTAIIGDQTLFEFLGVVRKNILAAKPAALRHVIHACASFKGRVVSQDEREGDLRRILNFGHTIGHAIEAATDYKRLLHGEAVAWGMLAATRLAVEEKLLSDAEAARISALVSAYGPVPSLTRVSMEAIERALGVDKKVRDGHIHFILPKRIGDVIVVGGIPASRAVQALESVIVTAPFERTIPAPKAGNSSAAPRSTAGPRMATKVSRGKRHRK
jgi:3-dehydroquinate synthase